MKELGIKYQLRVTTLIPMFFVALLLVILYNLDFYQERQNTLDHLEETYTQPLLPIAQWALSTKHYPILETILDKTAYNPNIQSIAFYDAEHTLMSYRGAPPDALPQNLSDKKIKYEQSSYLLRMIHPITQENDPKKIIGWLSININTTSTWIKHYKTALLTGFLTILGVVLGLIIHHYLTRSIYIPIHKLRQSMKAILKNDFDTPIEPSLSSGDLGIITAGCAHLQKKYLNTLQEIHQYTESALQELQKSHELLEEKNIELLLDKRKADEKYQQKSLLLQHLSHEIRTPMNAILGFSDLLMKGAPTPPAHDYIETIQASAKELLSIVNDILDYAQIEAKKIQLDIVPLNIRACIDDLLALNMPKAHQKNLELIASTLPNVPQWVLGDPIRLKQIINNLLSNAIKFTNQGYVLIKTSIHQEKEKHYELKISVSDTGIGIPLEAQERLFQPFEQASKNIFKQYGGSGLGLVISQQLAEQMHGKIILHSEPNQGTTFYVHVQLQKLPSYEIEKHQKHPLGYLKALCFDEHPLHLEALCHGLQCFDIECEAISSFSALGERLSQAKDHDIAFIGLNQGQEQLLKECVFKSSIPLVLISKWFIPNYARLGAASFLFKPPNIEKLHETLTALFKQQDTKLVMYNDPRDIDEQRIEELRKKLRQEERRFLIVDDNKINQMLLFSWLNNCCSIELANNGEDALLLCKQKPFQLILLDLNMPHMDGFMCAKYIQEQSGLNHSTPILLITATTVQYNTTQLKQHGITAQLPKPITELQLLETLYNTLCEQTQQNPLMALFIEDLKQYLSMINHFFSTIDHTQLAHETHKLLGACCFFNFPSLKEYLTVIEHAAKEHFDETTLKPILKGCAQHIDELLSLYNKS